MAQPRTVDRASLRVSTSVELSASRLHKAVELYNTSIPSAETRDRDVRGFQANVGSSAQPGHAYYKISSFPARPCETGKGLPMYVRGMYYLA
eukprot:1958250-Prymnesium_polylepis.1